MQFFAGISAVAFIVALPLSALANEISDENLNPGTPQAVWDAGVGSDAIRGFSADISYQKGERAAFKVSSSAPFSIEIYRVGWYGGAGARIVATVRGQADGQSPCVTGSDGLYDCGNWRTNATWRIPGNAVSGVYIGKAVRDDTLEASHIVFVVRDDSSHSDIVVQTSDPTWQAYNEYGGGSLYRGAATPSGRASKVSYNRPFIWRNSGSYAGVSNFFTAEYPLIRWLEANGYDVTYTSGVDTNRRGGLLKNHRVFVSSGHDEYWSELQRANVEAARDAGVSLAFLSGNEVFWKTRYEPSIAGPTKAHRTLVCYKETMDGRRTDPSGTWTGTWRDGRFRPAMPENALTGTLFTVNGIRADDMVVTGKFASHPFWRNTDVAGLGADQSIVLGTSILGFEWDEDIDNGYRPPGLQRLSETAVSVPARLVDEGANYAPGVATHSLTLYRHASGALVFGAGTVQWAWGLDGTHDNNAGSNSVGPDRNIQQATKNVLADMGAD